jgi:hypothetical protein
MKEITIMKTAGRLFSNIEFITVVALTALALVMVVAGGVGDAAGGGPAAGIILEIFCKAFVALVNAAVVFSKALVVFSNLSLTVSDIAPLPVAFVLLLFNPAPSVVVLVLMSSVALGVGEGEIIVATTALSKDKLPMNNRNTRMTAITVFIILFSFYS